MHAKTGQYYSAIIAVVFIIFILLFDPGTVSSSSFIKRNYDTVHIALRLSLNEHDRSLTGVASLTIVPLDSQFSRCQFHAKEMEIKNVRLNSSDAVRFHSDSNKIYIEFTENYTPRDTIRLTISYYAKPQKGVYFNISSEQDPDIPFQIYSHSEPTDARYWFPCYDAPDDKLTSEIAVTVNDTLSVVSNGTLIGVRHDPDAGTKTFHWKQSKPHVNYLISFAAGIFHVVPDHYQTIPMNYYVYPDNFNNTRFCFGKTKAMMTHFSELFDYPYPWDKYDQVLIHNYKSRGMEHTSVTNLSDIIMHDKRTHLDKNCDNLVAHELAHQWFGNLVTCESWPHTWLNEGFATYAEILFTEAEKGGDAAMYALYLQRNSYLRSENQEFMQPIVYSYYTHPREMFSHVTYQKASLVLHMLRKQIGDERFFKMLSTYLRQFAFQSLTTDDFIHVVETVTGEDLNWFFDQWLNHGGYPDLKVRYEWDQFDRQVILKIDQIQEKPVPVFKFPVDIKIITKRSSSRQRVFVESRSHIFRLSADNEPLTVLFDPDHTLLKTIDFNKSQKESLFQLRNDVHPIGRIDAIDSFKENAMDTSAVVDGLTEALRNDSFWAVRRKAAYALSNFINGQSKTALIEACSDINSKVRSACIHALGEYDEPVLFPLFKKIAQTDSSYWVKTAAIYEMVNIPDSLNFELLEPFFKETSPRGMVQTAAFTALSQIDDARSLPLAIRYANDPAETFSRRYAALRLIEKTKSRDWKIEQVLIKMLNSKDEKILHKVIQILSDYGTEKTMFALKEKLEEDISDGTRRRIRYAFSKIESSMIPQH